MPTQDQESQEGLTRNGNHLADITAVPNYRFLGLGPKYLRAGWGRPIAASGRAVVCLVPNFFFEQGSASPFFSKYFTLVRPKP